MVSYKKGQQKDGKPNRIQKLRSICVRVGSHLQVIRQFDSLAEIKSRYYFSPPYQRMILTRVYAIYWRAATSWYPFVRLSVISVYSLSAYCSPEHLFLVVQSKINITHCNCSLYNHLPYENLCFRCGPSQLPALHPFLTAWIGWFYSDDWRLFTHLDGLLNEALTELAANSKHIFMREAYIRLSLANLLSQFLPLFVRHACLILFGWIYNPRVFGISKYISLIKK